MKTSKEQEREISTIKGRTITINLSDADCERIAKKAGKHGITIEKLLENFIGDLIDGTYSNGSDERYRANQWFERYWFGMFPEETLLKFFLEWDYDLETFVTICDELEHYKTNPQEFSEELEEAKEKGEEMLWFEQEYYDYTHEFLNAHANVDMKKEIELCKKWLIDLKRIKGDS